MTCQTCESILLNLLYILIKILMTAIPKALAMANPKHVFACVATVAGVISSKFAIDAVSKY